MGKEKVTILLAACNGEAYLKRQLKSIKEQDFKDWKLIAGDDGSKDGTLKILSEFKEGCENEVRIVKNNPPTGSAKANFMKLIKMADTPYIMFCDQDDIWKKDKISRTYNCMIKAEGNLKIPILVHSDLYVLKEGGVLSETFFEYQNLPRTAGLSRLLIQNFVTGCTVMINEELKARMLMAKDLDKIIMHDYWAALIAKVYGKICFINEPTMYYRQHEGNSVGAKPSKNPAYLLKRLLSGRKDYKMKMRKSWEQAGYFIKTYNRAYPINKDKLRLMKGYAMLGKCGKLQRIVFYKKNKVLKNGFIRVMMQYLWG